MADKRIFASPLARRIAEQNSIDLAAIKGSGPHGRIVEADVKNAKAGGTAPAKAAPAADKAGGKAADKPATPKVQPQISGEVERIKLDAMRKVVAKRMTEAKSTVPHFYLTMDCEIDLLLAARKRLNEAMDAKVSVNDFIIKASAHALMAVPEANVTWDGDAILRHPTADISVAVAMEGGLITPVVRSAEQKGLRQISDEMRDLAARARNKKLKPEEYQGGSFSISNLGMFGVREFSAVINPPQGMILAVGAGEKRAVVRANDQIEVATIMSVTVSCDHRSVDGALGARWLQHFKRLIEDPVQMLA